MVASPLQTASVSVRHPTVPPYHEYDRRGDRTRAEHLLEDKRLLLVVEQPQPIYQLAQAMLDARRPFGAMAATAHKHADFSSVLELDKSVGALDAVSDNSVGGELPEKRNLNSKAVIRGEVTIVGAYQGK